MAPMRPTECRDVGRRRFIAIAGAFGGTALLPTVTQATAELHHWRGVALGARASIRLLHPDPAEAHRIIDLAVQEIERLEAIFSLYRGDSALAVLNRDGRLPDPPLELVELLSRAREVSRLSGGAFDVTVQPLWQRYRDHFATHAGTALPAVADLLPLVDWRALRIDPTEVALTRSGMAVTLNGIAQGFVTDRVHDLLRRNGIGQVLLDLGEIRAAGDRGDGRPWHVGIADPGNPDRSLRRLDCVDRAIATSGGYGTVFDRGYRYSHLIDPRNGRTAPVLRGTTVTAPDATTADAWSTAFALMTRQEVVEIAPLIGDMKVYFATMGSVAQIA
ncbi:MAG: FAD:protein FMN transferase [Thalassobaculum sp.]|uniref:FAD:protein FMN transferase n=2 Tax=Thalassobaculum sp. TaxID=2022740 RepID=UPI0032EEEC16